MKIYIAMRCMEYEYTIPVSAHIDKLRADAAAEVFDKDSDKALYGEVQEIELDLTGAPTAVKVAIAQSHV